MYRLLSNLFLSANRNVGIVKELGRLKRFVYVINICKSDIIKS